MQPLSREEVESTLDTPIFVVADDLTGAADAANYFRTNSHRVRVSFQCDTPWQLTLGPSVVQVFDAESRGLSVHGAAERMSQAAAQLVAGTRGAFRVYKKIDSTLRGHIGSEIEALLRALGRRVALLAPSFPANGRIVRDGRLFVGGLPVSQTAFGRDPRNPVFQDEVGAIVRQTTGLPVISLGESVIRRGAAAVAEFLQSIAEPLSVVVADAETDEDLGVLAGAVTDANTVLPCGSAGLAKQLAARWVGAASGLDGRLSGVERPSCHRVLVAVGSANPVSHEQLRHVATARRAQVVELQPGQLATAGAHDQELAQAVAALTAAREVVTGVTLAEARAQRQPDVPGSFEQDLAEAAYQWFQAAAEQPGSPQVGFVATGGDTALALCQAISAGAIWPQGEVVPGMPWSLMETPSGDIPLVSKAGGFGGTDALLQAVAFLLGEGE
ncbi:MAG: hypothetical protein K6T78_15105 [Alicyclobacillus sp.]|nr:hypothetical protein [Alicyclobacillus sp.]